MGHSKKGGHDPKADPPETPAKKNRDKLEMRVTHAIEGAVAEKYVPLVDIVECPNEIRIIIEVPGVPKENLELYLTGNALVIEGMKHEKPMSRRLNYLCLERYFGPFKRVIEVPIAINSQKIRAVYTEGVLEIFMPKIEDRRGTRKRIEIE